MNIERQGNSSNYQITFTQVEHDYLDRTGLQSLIALNNKWLEDRIRTQNDSDNKVFQSKFNQLPMNKRQEVINKINQLMQGS